MVELASNLQPYPKYLYNLLRLLFVINIFIAILPLLRPKDTLADIPLTPAQRSLLGLSPSKKEGKEG
jgi:nucleoporin POM34